jgi:hypothetical protein
VHILRHLERVGARQRQDPDPNRVLPAQAQILRVALRTKFDAPDVTQAQEPAVGVRAQDEVTELFRGAEAALGVDRDLVRLIATDRRRADCPGRDRDVLSLERGHDVAGREPVLVHPDGIEPEAHRVAALAEDADVVDAADALEDVDDIERRIVAQHDAIEVRVGRRERHTEDKGAVVLGDRQAGVTNLRREAAKRVLYRGLHVGRSVVDAAVEKEGTCDGDAAVARRRGADIA